jgi:hypothetical protein
VARDHSSPSNAEVKSEWSFTSTPPIRLYSLVRRIRDMHFTSLLRVSWKESVGRPRSKWSDTIKINSREMDGEDTD